MFSFVVIFDKIIGDEVFTEWGRKKKDIVKYEKTKVNIRQLKMKDEQRIF